MIIGLSGKMKSGKDTVADILVRDYGFTKLNFADPLKKCVAEIFGWDISDMYDQKFKATIDPFWEISPRQALQSFGTDICRDVLPRKIKEMFGTTVSWYNNIWVRRLERELLKNPDKDYVICDVRFTNEANFIESFGAMPHSSIFSLMIRIDASYKGYSISKQEHISETALDNYSFSRRIENNKDVKHLENRIHTMIKLYR